MKERIEKTLTGLQPKLKILKQSASPFKTFIHKEFSILENITLQKSGWKDEKEDFRLHLFRKTDIRKNKVATCEFTKPIQVLLNASRVFISLKGINFKGVRWRSKIQAQKNRSKFVFKFNRIPLK